MPQVENLVNNFGKMAGWNSFTLNLFGHDVRGFLKLTYKDNVETDVVYGQGKMPIGYGEGNYKATVELELTKEEVDAILDSIPTGKRISDAAPVDVPGQYEYANGVKTDIIRNFKVTGLGRELKQGDKVVGQKIECFCTHIDWNV